MAIWTSASDLQPCPLEVAAVPRDSHRGQGGTPSLLMEQEPPVSLSVTPQSHRRCSWSDCSLSHSQRAWPDLALQPPHEGLDISDSSLTQAT